MVLVQHFQDLKLMFFGLLELDVWILCNPNFCFEQWIVFVYLMVMKYG